MHKSLIALFALCTLNGALAAGDWQFQITNNAGKVFTIPAYGKRECICLKNSQTNKIKNTNGGVMKLFSTHDCSGNFVALYKGSTSSNAQWVNSASIGQDGVPSTGPNHCDPAY